MPFDHLTPDDIERLLDGEEGVARAPMADHVAGCPDCRHALADARQLVMALESLGDLAPSASFADRVMAEVHVFEPWHAALGRTVSPWIPTTAAGRIAAGVGVTVAGAGITAGSLWLLARADMAVLLAGVGLSEVRTHILGIGHDLARVITGPVGSAPAVSSSPTLIGAAIGSAVLAATLSLLALWRLAERTSDARSR